VLEFVPCEAVIVACHGQPGALDELPNGLGMVLRIAPDEAWVVGTRSRRGALLRSATLWLAAADPTGVAVDQTDGWALYSGPAPAALAVLPRISVARLPSQRPALVQGALSGVPGKVVLTEEHVYLFVPSPVGHHLEARLRETGADLGVRIGAPAPAPIPSSPQAMVEAVR
jgi:hypothetical protein